MKKIIIALTALVFLFVSIPSFADSGRTRENNSHYKKQKMRHEMHNRQPAPRVYRRNYHHGHDYNYSHHGKHYTYDRHYRWHEWNKMRHDRRYQGGHYHSDNGYLMFSFCEPDSRLCFSISID